VSKSLPLFGVRAAVAVARSGAEPPSPGWFRFQSRLYAICAIVLVEVAFEIAVLLPIKDFMMRASGGIPLALAVLFALRAVRYRNLGRRAVAGPATRPES
jgi:hypothetical protein